MSYLNPAKQTSDQPSNMKLLTTMVSIGLICALLIVVSFQGTLPRIEQLKAEALEKAIFKVIPGIEKKKTFMLGQDNLLMEVTGKAVGGEVVFAGYDKDGRLVGVAIEASGMGFADVLKVIYGYDMTKEQIVGFYVLESKETPGLGDKIEKDAAFLANFQAMDVALADDKSGMKNKINTVKKGAKKNAWEVDGITGATISSRAIGNLLAASTEKMLPIIFKNKDILEEKAPK
jgi:electron transport complex protein RnfG